MPKSKPDANILLQAAINYLEQELIPTLADYHRFQTRVTINVLNIVHRELELADRQALAEHERLTALLRHDGALQALDDELVEQIRTGAMPLDEPALRDHVRRSLAEALAINNPKRLARS